MAEPSAEDIQLRAVRGSGVEQPEQPLQNIHNQGRQPSLPLHVPGLEELVPPPRDVVETAAVTPVPAQPSTSVTELAPVSIPTTTQGSPAPESTNNTTPSSQVSAGSPVGTLQPNQASIVTNGATATPIPSSPGPLRVDASIQRSSKTSWGQCWSMKGPISLIVVYAITTLIIVTASDVNGPLARLGVTGGFLVLNILALLNNYALIAAGNKAWEYVQWGPLMRHGQNLTTFLALSNSSGVGGWLRIVFHGGHVPNSIAGIMRRGRNLVNYRTSPPAPANARSRAGQSPSMVSSRIWGFSRVGFWLLIQFPGLIFMTQVDPRVDYRPTNWELVSGGMGKYNVSVAALGASNGALLSGLALNMVRDATVTKSMPAVSKECTQASNCTSYIIPGALKNLTPIKFLSENGSALPIYITRKTPVYQLDFWDASIIPWAEKDCSLFGSYGTSGSSMTGFQICMTPYKVGQILAAFKFCNDLVTSDGSCAYEDGWRRAATWSGFVAMYRRNATVAFERKTGVLLDIKDLSRTEAQDIPPADFLAAFKGMLLPWKQVNTSFECDESGPKSQLTRHIAVTLDTSRFAAYQVEPREILRNIFMVPLYFYNPITSPLTSLPTIITLETDLPKENYIYGSYAVEVNHLEISWWTVLTYIAVCGAILVSILLVLAVTMRSQVQETSDYPVIDFLKLRVENTTTSGNTGANIAGGNIATTFTRCSGGREIIESSRGLRMLADNRETVPPNGPAITV